MATKITKNQDRWHKITLRADSHEDDRVVLVGGGKRAYLWAQGHRNGGIVHISGAATLRALAKAILEEVGDE